MAGRLARQAESEDTIIAIPKELEGLDISRLFGELAAIVQDHPEANLDDIRREMPVLQDLDDDTLSEWVEAARVQGIE